MFKKDGAWKEFGTISTEHSVFPFWLFCIVWAILSYIITMLIVGEYSNAAVCAGVTTLPLVNANTDEESPEDLVEPLPLKTTTKRKNIINKSMSGYHMLNENATAESGVPQYVYVGDTPLKKPGYYMLNNTREDLSKPKYTYVGNERPVDISSEEE